MMVVIAAWETANDKQLAAQAQGIAARDNGSWVLARAIALECGVRRADGVECV